MKSASRTVLVLSFLPYAKALSDCSSLLWSDEFNGSGLDPSKWSYQVGDGCDLGICGWGNNEVQNYTEGDNLEVSGGTLKIIAKHYDGQGGGSHEYTSSRIRSLGLADFDLSQNIRVEARLKVP